MKKYLALILISFTFCSCNRTEKKEEKINNEYITNEEIKSSSFEDSSAVTLFQNIPTVVLPYSDSTNFDNDNFDSFSNQELLAKIKFKKNEEDIRFAVIRYLIPFSAQYYSVVLTYQMGENELFTTLINIDRSLKIIDQIDIAYDEIAESAFRTESIIQEHQIKKTNSNYMDGNNPIHDTELITISAEGKFIKQN